MRAPAETDFEQLIAEQWPRNRNGRLAAGDNIYLNNGSCGLKPKAVLDAINSGWQKLNQNPTLYTFVDNTHWDEARSLCAGLFSVAPEQLILSPNSTWGIQLVMQSLLVHPGDELVTTDHEHGCVNTLARYLSETRSITVRKHESRPEAGSQALCQGLLNLVTEKTRLVLVSEIDCYTGWRPDLSQLLTELDNRGVAVLVDGAHAPGQGPLNASRYPFWVASGHKWLGGPNATGFVYARQDWVDRLRPLTVGDRLYAENQHKLHAFEWPGTTCAVRWAGLAAAARLQELLGSQRIAQRQKQLAAYLRRHLSQLDGCTIRTPNIENESAAILTAYFDPPEQQAGFELRQWLWDNHQIWTQPDFIGKHPGSGLRISCQVFVTEQDLDDLVTALRKWRP